MEPQTKIPRIYIWLPIIFGLIALGCYIEVRRLENKIVDIQTKELLRKNDSVSDLLDQRTSEFKKQISEAKQGGKDAVSISKSINEKKIVKKQFVKPSLDSSYRDILNLP